MTVLELYDDATLTAVRDQLVAAPDHDMYEMSFDEAAIDPDDVDSRADFRELPFTSVDDLLS